ncbi:helix-turn-helix transcriptional regulator [Streptomyces sp. SID13666]|uniref:helix-turn-helix domain-containing protein n=1 Tax=unclassified Streptomyces TaxID=2593676 RepID=UPI0013BF79B5|nr:MULTISPECIES: helix-turn-helix domain-containing protein [unclassified Streptomyces]NEA59226.1 helix-turn-helix transcriptional regulator [Streptomyces sp. SID13666]NEA74169.1 helix-turn-helix transcriptional regulator [Streptomyces sp. SID13588]
MASEHLGDRLSRLRRLADLTQEGLAERSSVSVDVVRKLEQKRKNSARLPTLHALALGLGVELTSLLGDPPGVPSNGEADPPALVAVRRAIMPPLFAPVPESSGAEALSLPLLRAEIAEGWTLYHDADFGRLMDALPGIIADARLAAAVGSGHDRAAAQAALGKALQLGGHLAIRLGKSDLALSSLERAIAAAEASSDPLLAPMVSNSIAWAYQRQNRLDDAAHLAVYAADGVERDHGGTAEGVRVWGGLLMSAATSAARSGDYETADEMMTTAERAAGRLVTLPPPENGKLVSVFSRSSVRIERVRLAVQHARPEEALHLAKGMRLSPDTPPSWRTWLLLDVARAYADIGDADGAVKALEKLHRVAPAWMRHHTLAVAIVNDLWTGAVRPPGLRKLAAFLGVAE